MNTPVNPHVPLYLAEFAFGLCYAILIHWMAMNRYGRGGTAISVVVGVGGTLLIQWTFAPISHVLVLFGSFACSGTPMVLSYFYRYEKRKKSHKARPLPPWARRQIEDVMLDMDAIMHDTVENGLPLAKIVLRLGDVKTILQSMKEK